MTDEHRTDGNDLDRRLDAARAEQRKGVSDAEARAESRGWAIGVEFVGAILVGAFLGWLLDRWLGTAPWLLIVFFLLGFATGVRRAMQTSKQFDATQSNDD